ncbi:hypothetical protein [Sinimarinibacterium flocculans]|uniref:Uncharacterized protein n=1 Tax=Sinimarinibacterium flocculans TaxID=985250 RepID=A0A318E635_9GAMM|nr:hypothetical protein [Sinimarinibacterium flocculans]PXV65685.1 hypothetical protein C8D93_10964 [Sinimarinibacterium flocculans]
MEELMRQLGSGQIGIATVLVWTALAFIAALAGGALAGLKLAGKDLGNDLASLMGAMFGPTAAVPAVLVGLIVLMLV